MQFSTWNEISIPIQHSGSEQIKALRKVPRSTLPSVPVALNNCSGWGFGRTCAGPDEHFALDFAHDLEVAEAQQGSRDDVGQEEHQDTWGTNAVLTNLEYNYANELSFQRHDEL